MTDAGDHVEADHAEADHEKYPPNFISQRIKADLDAGKVSAGVITRFPPEPNGYLHIGHAKAVCLNFGMAADFGGLTNLRFDDTNPLQEDEEFVAAIQQDIEWLGFHWHQLHFTSEYFGQLYDFALYLIRNGKAYVDSLTQAQLREDRGTFTEPGRESPARNNPVEENLRLFERMKKGDFADGERVLRLKLDMASPNMNMRDPVIYRIRHARHHNTGDAWCIYPMYDYAHSYCDAVEGVTHSLCDLSYEDHRPLYDWIAREKLARETNLVPAPQQLEFARLNMAHTVMSKRHLKRLVRDGLVEGWDDPRMPTLAGMRRRGYPPAAIRDFCRRIGVSKADNLVEPEQLEAAVRDALEPVALRVMGVLKPLRLVITDYARDGETLMLPNHPGKESLGRRKVSFSREVFIEQDDFREAAGRKFKRLVLGDRVRLRGAYIIRAEKVLRDAAGRPMEVHCTHDPESLGRQPATGKPRGVIHWVSATTGVPARVRLLEHLFTVPRPDPNAEDFAAQINPNSLQVLNAVVEAGLSENKLEPSYQFERLGYFKPDPDSRPGALIFNRTVSLRDSRPPEAAG